MARSELRRFAVIALAIAGAVATAVLANQWSIEYLRNVVDDSLISMNYARRLASGDGLVFNPGEHVEGYTNFLWTVSMAPVFWLSRLFHADFVRGCVAWSILVASLDVGLLAVLGRRLWGDRVLPIALAVGLCALDNAYTVWAMMALESHFVALWVLLALLVWTGRSRSRELLTGICLAAVPRARPDGALFVAAFATSEALGLLGPLFRRDFPRLRMRLGSLALAGASFAVVFGAYFFWRYRYYGFVFPNTFYLKVGSSHFAGLERGIPYVKAFLEERGNLPLFALVALPWLANPTVRTLALWIPVHAAYVAYVGGDFYSGHRFLVQLIPALALLSGQVFFGLGELARRPRVDAWLRRVGIRSALGALAAVYVWGMLGQVWVLGMAKGALKLEIRTWRYPVDAQRRYMLWLSHHSHPDQYICAGDIGSAGLYADLRVIDYYGVIDAYVAHQDVPTLGRGKAGHEKTAEVEYVLSRRPDFIKWGYLPGEFWSRGYYFDNQIPPDIGMPGIWVRNDLPNTRRVDEAASFRFGAARYPGWTAEGNAFERWPSSGSAPGQGGVSGTAGYYLSSYHATLGDRATGTLRSAPFPIVGDRISLRVGGGRDLERLYVGLVVEGRIVRRETGANGEMMGQREWDSSELVGKTGEILVVDQSSDTWGHIMLDEIEQWRPR